MDVRLMMIRKTCLLCRKTYHMVCANVKTKSSMYMCTDCSETILQIKKDVKNIRQTLMKEQKLTKMTCSEKMLRVRIRQL